MTIFCYVRKIHANACERLLCMKCCCDVAAKFVDQYLNRVVDTTAAGTWTRLIILFVYISSICCRPVPTVDLAEVEDRIFDRLEIDDTLFDQSDEDDEDDLSPVPVDEILSGKMIAFFEKLNSLRRKRRENRRKSKYPFFGSELDRPMPHGVDTGMLRVKDDPGSLRVQSTAPPEGNGIAVRAMSDASHPLPPHADDDRNKTGRKGSMTDHGICTVDHPEITDGVVAAGGMRFDGTGAAKGVEAVVAAETAELPTKTSPRSADGDPRNRLHATESVGYLGMGWSSVWCLWHRYRKAETERERTIVRELCVRYFRFWATVVGASFALLWSAFGVFHELFGCGLVVPADAYAKNVNKYLTMVPPHVVVTNRGKMFRYQPTPEERFLWESAKKIANFKI